MNKFVHKNFKSKHCFRLVFLITSCLIFSLESRAQELVKEINANFDQNLKALQPAEKLSRPLAAKKIADKKTEVAQTTRLKSREQQTQAVGNRFIGVLPTGEQVQAEGFHNSLDDSLMDRAREVWNQIEKKSKNPDATKLKVKTLQVESWESFLPKLTTVDAFRTDAAVENVSHEVLSYEGVADESKSAWIISRGNKYLPTISWQQKEVRQLTRPVPLFSENAKSILHKTFKRSIKANSGIVYGKIAAGWTLVFSGAGEKVLYLDTKEKGLKVVGAESWNKEREFIILNAAPGGHLIHLVGPTPEQKAVVAVPVFSDTVSFLHLQTFAEYTFSGRIIDASVSLLQGASGVMIYQSGAPDKPEFTNKDGTFSLNHVFAFDKMPVWFDTLKDGQFAQRYRLDPTNKGPVRLYFLADEQYEYWLSQLEGEIIEGTGYVVASLPTLIQSTSEQSIFPEVQVFEGLTDLLPEVYTLGVEGRLMVNEPLTAASPRLFSAQLGQGPALIRVVNQGQRVIYSRLIYTSEKTVNVIGPE